MIDTAELVFSSILSGLPSTSKSTQIMSLLCFLTLCTSKVANMSSYASTSTSTSTACTSWVLVDCLGLPCCLEQQTRWIWPCFPQVSLALVCCVQSTCQREYSSLCNSKHRGWQFPLLQQSPQLWNTSVWLLTVIAFGFAYFEVHRPLYLVALRSDSRQNYSVCRKLP